MIKRKIFLALACVINMSILQTLCVGAVELRKAHAAHVLVVDPVLDRNYCQKILDAVDKSITKRIYSEKLAREVWPKSLAANKEKILASKNLVELQERMTVVLSPLASSHLNFVTNNDPMRFYLKALFSDLRGPKKAISDLYTGFVSGGADFAQDKIRYVVNDSPASKAGLRIGDRVLKVDSEPFVGMLNFHSTKKHKLLIERDGQNKTVSISPIMTDYYAAYNNALESSTKQLLKNGKKIGYVHIWGGGNATHEVLAYVLTYKLRDCDALILDMRDGYGGNSLEDLDMFFRQPENYPDFTTVDRAGKTNTVRYFYDKPVVALINKGSRSGKEILAYALKKTKRAKLIGDTTGGAVLAGNYRSIDENCGLYLPVLDVKLDGVKIEGLGVEPDIKLENKEQTQAGYDNQLNEAIRVALEEVEARAKIQTQENAGG